MMTLIYNFGAKYMAVRRISLTAPAFWLNLHIIGSVFFPVSLDVALFASGTGSSFAPRIVSNTKIYLILLAPFAVYTYNTWP